jgi:Zinc carboxypeptidase
VRAALAPVLRARLALVAHAGLALALVAALAGSAPARAAGQRACPAPAAASVPTWEDVNGFPLGSREATDEQVLRYVRAVGHTSSRVRSGVYGTSVEGRPLPYAIAGDPDALRAGMLDRLTSALRRLRAGQAPRAPLRSLRPIVWLAGSVHSNEPSGADADMAVLERLARGGDCTTMRELRRLLVVIAPVQNPDGRAAGTRVNAAGFDLNRDWFAGTQPETRARSALLTRLPPVVLADQHEESGTAFFFPPDTDPVHHEVPRPALHAIDTVFGPALRRAFDTAHDDYTTGTTYDLFFMGYGDTVSTTLYGAAGMTFEKGGDSAYPERVAEHRLAADTVLRAAAGHARSLLRGWAGQWRQATAQGAAGVRQANVVLRPGNALRFRVPAAPVRAYALRADVAAGDAAALVARLRAAGVVVERLKRTLHVGGYRPYGASADGSADLPAGTYVVPMAQAQKHWVEAMLGVDAYVPFPYFYDVSSWSNALLMGLEGGSLSEAVPGDAVVPAGDASPPAPAAGAPAYAFAGDSTAALAAACVLLRAGLPLARDPRTGDVVLAGDARLAEVVRETAVRGVAVRALGAAPDRLVALRAPRVALLAGGGEAQGGGPALSESWARYVLARRLGLAVETVRAGDLAAGVLARVNALVVPDGTAQGLALGPQALAAIQAFVRGGGTYVGERGQGLAVAQAAGVTAVKAAPQPADLQIPGAALRVAIDPTDPLGWGSAGAFWAFDTGDPILAGGHPAATYPAGEGFFVSGSTTGIDALRGTPAATDEPTGAGRTVLFAFDAAFRGYVEGTERLLANALLAPRPGLLRGGVAGRAAETNTSRPLAGGPVARRAAGTGAARPLNPAALALAPSPFRDAVIRVALGDEAALRAAARAAGVPHGARIDRDLGGITLRVPNPRGLDAGERPWTARLPAALARAGVRPLLAAF